MALGQLFSATASIVINAWPNKRLLDYSYLRQLRDMLPAIALSALMGLVIYPVIFLALGDWLTLLVQVPLGILIYITGSGLFRIDSFDYMLSMAKRLLRRGKENA